VKFSSETQIECIFDLDEMPRFNVVILYEDGPAGRRAKRLYDKLNHELGDECDFNLKLWNFQVLAIPEFGESAMEAAAQADLVILSLHGKAGLPAEIKQWIETWTGQIIDRTSALVALVDKPSARGGTTASTLAYLSTVANRTGIDFFAHTVFSDINTVLAMYYYANMKLSEIPALLRTD
jgi:hypothetical protein